MGGPIDPIEEVRQRQDAGEGGRPRSGEVSYRRVLHGEVLSVRSRTVHHEEGHVLDATVGEQAHDELVVRVSRGNVEDLTGKHVVISVEP